MHRIYLSRTNLLALIDKLDKQNGVFNPNATSIVKHDKQDPRFDQTLPIVCVTAVDDNTYYGEKHDN